MILHDLQIDLPGSAVASSQNLTLKRDAGIIRATMSDQQEPLILLTNDDGIQSPGLWAAAEALSSLGFVTVVAPREQSSGAGRSMPVSSDGKITAEEVVVNGKTWKVYAVGGSPAQAVQHGILEIMPRPPDLVVAGINYGENLTVGITISGTVGAALEGAAFNVPSLAVSLEMPIDYYGSHSTDIDFSAAAYFTATFGRMLLLKDTEFDVDVLKVDVPCDATKETEWKLSRLSRQKYYVPIVPNRQRLEDAGRFSVEVVFDEESVEPDSDVYVLRVARKVSVTPLSLDLTARVNLHEYDRKLRKKPSS